MSEVLLCLDPGHGGSDPGAIGFGLKEADVVLKTGKLIQKKLQGYTGIKVIMTRTDNSTKSLANRSAYANKNKAEYFLSLHNNAFSKESAHGFETFVYNGGVSSKTLAFQKVIHDEAMAFLKKHGITDRGRKRANYHVLRETKMPAALIETLFITNKKENGLLKSDKFLDEYTDAIVRALVKFFGLKKKGTATPAPAPTKGVYYRVVTGSFESKKNAEQQVKDLKAKGFDSFIVNKGKYHRVVTGSFEKKANAEQRVKELKSKGFDSFIDVYKK